MPPPPRGDVCGRVRNVIPVHRPCRRLRAFPGRQESLSELLETLDKSQPHFIRCVKPNVTKRPSHFDDDFVLLQLRYERQRTTSGRRVSVGAGWRSPRPCRRGAFACVWHGRAGTRACWKRCASAVLDTRHACPRPRLWSGTVSVRAQGCSTQYAHALTACPAARIITGSRQLWHARAATAACCGGHA